MKKLLILLISIAFFSTITYSQTKKIYLIVPSSEESLSVQGIYKSKENGSVNSITSEIESTIENYQGNIRLKLIELKINTEEDIQENSLKMVAGYKGNDGKYYFLVAPEEYKKVDEDETTETVKTRLESFSGTPFDAFEGTEEFNYNDYPGYRIEDNMRLSLIPVTGGSVKNSKEFTTSPEAEKVEGTTGINPNNSPDQELKLTIKGSGEVIEFKGDIAAKGAVDLIELEVTSVRFRPKSLNKVDKLGKKILTIGGTQITNNGSNREDGKGYLLTGDMAVKLYKVKNGNGKSNGFANGQWYMDIDGKHNGTAGNTVVLLEDTGVITSSGIPVATRVENRSRKRDTNIETSLIGNKKFTIKNIKE